MEAELGALIAEAGADSGARRPWQLQHSRPGEMRKMDSGPVTQWDAERESWTVGEELSWTQPWVQR